MKKAVWISYDLGVQGDYESLYTWLDEQKAIDCGDNLAFLEYEFSGLLLDSLTHELESRFKITTRARVYVIYQEQSRMKGKFIFGRRKAPPWSGYATRDEPEDVAEG